jgi:hypothetical protein
MTGAASSAMATLPRIGASARTTARGRLPAKLVGVCGQDPVERLISETRGIVHQFLHRFSSLTAMRGQRNFSLRWAQQNSRSPQPNNEEHGAAPAEMPMLVGGLVKESWCE